MGKRTLVLVVALLLAVVSAVAIWQFLSNIEDDVRADLEEVTVFRASEFIPEGSDGNASLTMFEESTELVDLVPTNAVTSIEQLRLTLSNRVAAGPISEKQVVTTDLWVDPIQEVRSLSELISPGKQAISIQTSEVRGVNGFIQPGDSVNVIITIDLPTLDADLVLDGSEEQLADLERFLLNEFPDKFFRILTTVGPNGEIQIDVIPDIVLEGDAGFVFVPGEGIQGPDDTGTEGEGANEGAPTDPGELVEAILNEDQLPGTIRISRFLMQNLNVLAVDNTPRRTETGDDVQTTTGAEGEAAGSSLAFEGAPIITLEVSAAEAEVLVYAFEHGSVWLTLVPEGYQPVETAGVTKGSLFE